MTRDPSATVPDGPPPAQGVRLPWLELPAGLRIAIERAVTGPIVGVTNRAGGFSPGVAAVLELAGGDRVFVKATGPALNPDSVRIYAMEAEIAAALPDRVPAPRLLHRVERDGWLALLFEYLPGRQPRIPWQAGELAVVLRGIAGLAESLTPSPLPVPTAAELFGPDFTGWRRLADQPVDAVPLTGRQLARLAVLEARWSEASAGDTLAHADLRADNLLLDGDRLWVVDWPWACRAAPWFDLLGMLPSMLMQGGAPDPELLVAEHPVFAGADPAAVTATLAALIGFFLCQSVQPAPAGLPTLRAFQRGQGMAGLPWLLHRAGLG